MANKKHKDKETKRKKENVTLKHSDQKKKAVKARKKTASGKKGTDKDSKKKRKTAKKGLAGKKYNNADRLLGRPMSEQVEHGKMVSLLAHAVGKELGMDEDELQDLVIAGFFHDIGKTELHLNNTESDMLMVEEMNSIREHPQLGYKILKKHGYSEEICEMVLYHHENWDGSGYPYNIEGWNIPLGACILRVCDVFCALVQNRPYRKSFSPDTALRIMIEEVEKYDLKVFLALQRVLHKGPGAEIILPQSVPEVEGVWKEL